jgi:hypothetical protein
MPTRATAANHSIEICPRCMTTKAAARGPRAEPALPPTWNSDCAKPGRIPAARRAIRDASGWKIDEPSPISATDRSTTPKLSARASSTSPLPVEAIPAAMA